MQKEKPYKSVSGHSLAALKEYHHEATNFFASEIMMLKEIIPKIADERQSKAALLLISCTQTGAALLQLANQTDSFTSESVMLSRAFMEKIINFCYVSVCDDKEYRAFILHPIYKQYYNMGRLKEEDVMLDEESNLDKDFLLERHKARKERQEKLKSIPIVREALEIFSLKRSVDKSKKQEWINKSLDERLEEIGEWGHVSWTNKSLSQRIEVIEKAEKCMDVFFALSKRQYYADASEALHGSLYGCSYGVGAFDPDFDSTKEGELDKKLFKDSALNLLHLGMLIHETFTLISYSLDIKELWDHSYNNRGMALNLHHEIIEKKI